MQAVLDHLETLDVEIGEHEGLPQFDASTLGVMQTCLRCASAIRQSVEACPDCAWPAGEVFPPHPPQHSQSGSLFDGPFEDLTPWQRSGTSTQIPNPERFSWGWAVLGFLLPMVGLIYAFTGRRNNPPGAHAALIGGLIGMFLLGFGGILDVLH